MSEKTKNNGISLEDIITAVDSSSAEKPSIIEALLSTVDSIFTNNRKLQKTRINHQQVRGIVKVIATQSFLRARMDKEYTPFLNEDTGEFTTQKYDDRVLTAIAEGVISSRISLDGKSRDEIIRIFQAVGGSAHDENPERNGLLKRFDY